MTSLVSPPRPSRWQPLTIAGWLTLGLGIAGLLPVALEAQGPTPFSSEFGLEARTLRGLRTEIAGVILQAQPGGRIALATLATPYPGEGEKARVPILIEIDGPSFLDSNQAETARVEVYAYALAPNLQIAGYFAEVFAVPVAELGESVWQSGLKFYGELELLPGDYTLRVLVRNYQSKAAGLVEAELQVSDFQSAGSFVLAPVFPGPANRDPWLPVRQAESEAEASYPFVTQGRALSPATRPVLVAERQIQAYLFARGLPTILGDGALELVVEGEAGGHRAPVKILYREPAPIPGVEVLGIRFAMPELDPGEYPIHIELASGQAPLASASIPVLALSKNIRELDLLWGDLRWRLTDSPTGMEAPDTASHEEETGKGRGGRRARRIAAAYRQVLVTLGQGDTVKARTALVEVESSTLGGSHKNALQLLAGAEYRVLEELARSEIESLLPVALLHGETYLGYRRRGIYTLAFHARGMVEVLAELYAEGGGSDETRRVAAQILTSLAGSLQSTNLLSSSRRLFELALKHDGENKAALLGLAASHERYGEYRRALAYFERVAAIDPKLSEGQLRMAVNLERLSAGRRSRALLREIVGREGTSWVRALAYEELARSFLATGSLAEAEEVLQEALRRFPEGRGCLLLLAHVHDRQQRPRRAGELLQAVRSVARPVAGNRLRPVPESPRKTYDNWPRETMTQMRQALSERASDNLATLSHLLATTEAGTDKKK